MFRAVFSTGSVTGAARVLNLSQPAVSRMLAHAEQQLRFPLFVREGGRLNPTAEAFALYAEVEKVMPRIDAIRQLADNLRVGHGSLRIAAVPSVAQSVIPLALASFCPGRPDLKVELRSLHTRDMIDSVLLRESDIGFDFGGVEHPTVSRQVLAQTCLYGVAPRGLIRESTLTPALLESRSIIRMASTDPLVQQLQQQGGGAWASAPAHIVAQSYHSALALVTRGLGVALVDPFTSATASRDSIDVFELAPPVPIRLEMCLPSNRPISAQASVLAENVKDAAASLLKLLRDRIQADGGSPT